MKQRLNFDARSVLPFAVEEAKQYLLARREIDQNGCWLWTLHTEKGGYGVCHQMLGGEQLVHRVAYIVWKGEISEGHVIDHVKPICKSTRCFNPEHLEAVLPIVNHIRSNSRGAVNLRTGFCKRGHPWTEENIGNNGRSQFCKPCRQAWDKVRNAARKHVTV